MASQARRYDTEMQMFVDEPRDLDLDHLRFTRWLYQQGRLGPNKTVQPEAPEPEAVAYG